MTDIVPDGAAHWERTRARRWTERDFDLLEAGDIEVTDYWSDGLLVTVVGSGPCPRCGHEHTFEHNPTGVGDVAFDVLSAAPVLVPAIVRRLDFPVACNCEGLHDGRPPAVDWGCGVAYQVKVEVHPP